MTQVDGCFAGGPFELRLYLGELGRGGEDSLVHVYRFGCVGSPADLDGNGRTPGADADESSALLAQNRSWLGLKQLLVISKFLDMPFFCAWFCRSGVCKLFETRVFRLTIFRPNTSLEFLLEYVPYYPQATSPYYPRRRHSSSQNI